MSFYPNGTKVPSNHIGLLMKAHQGESHAGGPKMGAARWHMCGISFPESSLHTYLQGSLCEHTRTIKGSYQEQKANLDFFVYLTLDISKFDIPS